MAKELIKREDFPIHDQVKGTNSAFYQASKDKKEDVLSFLKEHKLTRVHLNYYEALSIPIEELDKWAQKGWKIKETDETVYKPGLMLTIPTQLPAFNSLSIFNSF